MRWTNRVLRIRAFLDHSECGIVNYKRNARETHHTLCWEPFPLTLEGLSMCTV
jgi:hypothetical protein